MKTMRIMRIMKTIRAIGTPILPMTLLLPILLSCGTEEPPPKPETRDYFPLAVGNYWVYDETGYDKDNPTATRPNRHDVVDYLDKDFENDTEGALPVFVVENTFPSAEGDCDPRLEYIHDDGTRAVRMRQEVFDHATDALKKTRDYVPGLLRLDRNRSTVSDNWDEDHTLYDDGSTVGVDVFYLYEILEPKSVTVPAGTFDCMVVQRTDPNGSSVEVKVYYYAPGVGKVKEITGDGAKVEELAEYDVESPDGGV
jgi:hypothetical protein